MQYNDLRRCVFNCDRPVTFDPRDNRVHLHVNNNSILLINKNAIFGESDVKMLDLKIARVFILFSFWVRSAVVER